MYLKKFLLFGLIAAVLPAFAEEVADRKTATSLKYVTHELDTRQDKFTAEQNKAMEYTDTAGDVQKRTVKSDLGTSTSDTSLPMVGGVNVKLNMKQDDIAAVNDHTAVTYTGQSGSIGQKGIYQTTESYAAQSDNLIDAKTFNAALKNGLDSEFKCREDNRDPVSGLCWLYTIHNGTPSTLPPEYTELEFIQTDGNQWFDTEIYPTNKTAIDTKFVNNSPASATRIVIGDGWTSREYLLSITAQTNATLQLGNLYITQTNFWHTNTVFNVHMDSTNVNINGTTFNWTGTENTFTGDRTLRMFGAPDATSRNAIVDMYYLKITDNGAIVRNFIPAKHGNDIGMYDTVSRRFFTNAGTGTFTAGPEVSTNVYIPQNQ